MSILEACALSAAMIAWGGMVVWKAVKSRSARSYTYASWDGGLLLKGRFSPKLADPCRLNQPKVQAHAANIEHQDKGPVVPLFSAEEVPHAYEISEAFLDRMAKDVSMSATPGVVERSISLRGGLTVGRIVMRVPYAGVPGRGMVYAVRGRRHLAVFTYMAAQATFDCCTTSFERSVDESISSVGR